MSIVCALQKYRSSRYFLRTLLWVLWIQTLLLSHAVFRLLCSRQVCDFRCSLSIHDNDGGFQITFFRVSQASNSQWDDLDFLQVLQTLIAEHMTATCLTSRSLLNISNEKIHWVDENKGNPLKKEEMPSLVKAQIFLCLLSKSQTTEIQVIW